MSASGDGHGKGGDGHGPAAPSPDSGAGGHGPPTGAFSHGSHADHASPYAKAGVVIVQNPGACGCGKSHDAHHASGDDLLPRNWNVPEGVYRELAQLSRMAEDGGAPTATVGAAQAMLRVLLKDLQKQFGLPRKPKKRGGFLGWLDSMFGDGSPPPDDGEERAPDVVLAEAYEHGVITSALLNASKDLPLVRAPDVTTGASRAKPFVRFLIELADVIHAQPARLA